MLNPGLFSRLWSENFYFKDAPYFGRPIDEILQLLEQERHASYTETVKHQSYNSLESS